GRYLPLALLALGRARHRCAGATGADIAAGTLATRLALCHLGIATVRPAGLRRVELGAIAGRLTTECHLSVGRCGGHLATERALPLADPRSTGPPHALASRAGVEYSGQWVSAGAGAGRGAAHSCLFAALSAADAAAGARSAGNARWFAACFNSRGCPHAARAECAAGVALALP
nr:hypothetical protein [Tanacetum cinerariifolium]